MYKRQGGCDLVVIDIDAKSEKPEDIKNNKHQKDGFATWDQLREEHSDPLETVGVRTGGGGLQMYFKYPHGHIIKSGTDVLGPGIDIRARGGYVIVPPSETEARYTWEFSPADVEIAELPEWILTRINGAKEPEVKTEQPAEQPQRKDERLDVDIAYSALNALKASRADDYQQWVEVGMSLFGLGQTGLIAWNTWSKQSAKYKPGECEKKWNTFSKELQQANKINFGSLIHWAEEDGIQPFLRTAPKDATPKDYTHAMEALKYKFHLNEMNDYIYFQGERVQQRQGKDENDKGIHLNDVSRAVIEYDLRNYKYTSQKNTEVAVIEMAYRNRFHPIREYLQGLILEGHYDGEKMVPVDHIGKLCSFFTDKDNIFPLLLRKWLIGAVERIIGTPGQQHDMLVLDGPQGMGKSRFVKWLGSPLPGFYLQSHINPDDKDFLIRSCSYFIWEVEELGATMRRADIEALKAFITKETVSVRAPYGHADMVKPPTASFIGTINNSGGFLADTTGSRRYQVCTLTGVDWAYAAAIDINQVWAQAVNLFQNGERHELSTEDATRVAAINERYDVEDPLKWHIFQLFNIKPDENDKHLSSAEMIRKLRADDKMGGMSDNLAAQKIAAILSKIGCEKDVIRVNGQQIRVWRGVWER